MTILDPTVYRFEQLHIDVARNATDDFNPFHDPHRWDHVRGNPFSGPIALGFQLEALIDYLIEREIAAGRAAGGGGCVEGSASLPFVNYEFRFANAVQAGEPFRAEVRRAVGSGRRDGSVAHRVLLRKQDDTPILIGSRVETQEPRFLKDWSPAALPPLAALPDRRRLPGSPLFLKRKFLNNSNAKNFLVGSLVDQFFYFDEISERVRFPAIFTASLVSCALLEHLRAQDYNFELNPKVYTAHYLSIDRRLQEGLRSNTRLEILVDGPRPLGQSRSLSGGRGGQEVSHCFGMLDPGRVLFRAEVRTATLGQPGQGA